MAARRKVTMTAERDGRWWVISYQGEPVTQARRVADIEPMARDWLSMRYDRAEGTFNLHIKVELPEDLRQFIDAAIDARDSAAAASTVAAAATSAAIAQAKAKGIPVRDIGTLIGISHQRVAQLAS
jgi:hypothetical protein